MSLFMPIWGVQGSLNSPAGASITPRYGNARAAGDKVCGGISTVRPSLITTGLVSNEIVAGFKPSRLAVNLIVPGIRVERMATRLMPHSVLRYRLLVEFVLPEL